MKFWQALLIAVLTTLLIEGDRDNIGFVARLVHDGLSVGLIWLAWRYCERRDLLTAAEGGGDG